MAHSRYVGHCLEAANELAGIGIEAEVKFVIVSVEGNRIPTCMQPQCQCLKWFKFLNRNLKILIFGKIKYKKVSVTFNFR